MRSLLPIRSLLLLALLLGYGLAAHASHILGGDIAYTPIAATSSVPRYHIMVRMYCDVNGVPPSDIQLVGSYNGCNATVSNGFNLLVFYNQVSLAFVLSCGNSAGFAYKVVTYETDVNLTRGQWLLSAISNARTPDILNMPNSGAQGFAISASLDNSLVNQNSSPKFLSNLLPYLCGSQPHRYSFSTFESDGDSLVYSFVYPQCNPYPTVQCPQVIPSTLSPHFQLDNASGALTTTAAPVVQGRYSMVARVTEYRLLNGSWQPIGYVTRDVTYSAFASTNNCPHFTSQRLNGATTTQPAGQLVRVQAGRTATLLLDAADPDAGQTLTFASQSSVIIPGMSLQTLNPTQAQLTWQVPATLPPGRYTATVAVLDSGCPSASEEQTISFLVQAQPLATRATTAVAPAYPTPFREQVRFAAPAGQVVTIVDALGRVVAQLTSAPDGQVRWQPAATLCIGLYFARGADGRLLARLPRTTE